MDTTNALLLGLIGQDYESLFGKRNPKPSAWKKILLGHKAAVKRLEADTYTQKTKRTIDQRTVEKNNAIMGKILFFSAITLNKKGAIKQIKEN